MKWQYGWRRPCIAGCRSHTCLPHLFTPFEGVYNSGTEEKVISLFDRISDAGLLYYLCSIPLPLAARVTYVAWLGGMRVLANRRQDVRPVD